VVTSRQPDAAEAQIIANVLAVHRARFAKDAESAKKLIAFGESKADPKLKPVDLAAWTLVANLLLNLDEVVNKN
jgi:hypothetical protein